MYDPQQLLNLIDQNKWWILGGFGIVMVFQWIWLIECVRVAKRDRAYSMPVFLTFFWFAHDTGCVARFNDWFNVYDHWFVKLFWLGLLTAVVLELIFFSQVIKYGKDELVPGISTRNFILGLVAFQIGATVTWEYFKYVMGDPLYQASPTITLISYPLLGAALMLRRRSTIGQNVTMWWTFTAMTVGWQATLWIWYGPEFRSWQMIAGGIVATIGGLAMTYLVSDRSTWFTRRPLDVTANALTTAPAAVPAAQLR
jgi:uncharacterized membrane protein